MTTETAMGGCRGSFSPTLWTVVPRAKGRSREALGELIRLYWKPVYFYVRRRGASVEEAKDLSQGFFAELLERESLKGVEKDKGKFRTFLLTALERFLVNQAERARALKRGGGKKTLPLEFAAAETDYIREPAARESLEKYFNRQWGLAVLAQAMQALSAEFEPATFEALKAHLAGGPAYEATARRLNISVTKLNNLIHKARRRYRHLVEVVIAGSVGDPALVREELADLFKSVKS